MKKRRIFLCKALAGAVSVSMIAGTLPAAAMAAESAAGAQDGTYTASVTVEPDEDGDFTAYPIEVRVTVQDGAITDVGFTDNNTYSAAGAKRAEITTNTLSSTDAMDVLRAAVIEKNNTEDIDVVSEATCSSKAILEAVNAAIASAPEKPGTEPQEEATEQDIYVLMNIPYDKFYEEEAVNDVPVDAVSSATMQKTKNDNFSGTYHVNADGSDITGITYPVKVPAGTDLSAYKEITDDAEITLAVSGRGQVTTTTYKGAQALFENPSYAYYRLSTEPAAYKELSVGEDGSFHFGKTNAQTATAVSGIDLATSSRYGDYQIDLDDNLIPEGKKVIGAIIHTTDGYGYGLRSLENIWVRTNQISWGSGFMEKESHGNTLNPAAYISMMGKTISDVTYYLSDYSLLNVDVEDVYVPWKHSGSVSAENADYSSGRTNVSVTGLPADFEAEYNVSGLENVSYQNGILTFNQGTASKGIYTLTVSDKSGKYAAITANFELYTSVMPAAFNGSSTAPGLVKAEKEEITETDLKDYLSNITSVSVNGTSYPAFGRQAKVLIDPETGGLNTADPIFAEEADYEIAVSSTGYKELTFQYVKKAAEIQPEKEEEAEKKNGLSDTKDADGNWYYYADGKIGTGVTTVAKNKNGWWYVKNGKVDFTYTGIAKNENGWWRIVKGKVDFNCNSVEKNENGWWYIRKGKVDFGYTGIAKNKNGWWRIVKGKVDFNCNSVEKNENGWWYIRKGKVDFGYTGIAKNKNGWWRIVKGKVDFSCNSVEKNENGWWYLRGGKVDFAYNGIAKNQNGWWVIRKGKVDFKYNGTIRADGRTWRVVRGRLVR